MSQSPPDPGNAKPPAPRTAGNALQQAWQQTQPVLKSATARSLRGTIWLLQQALLKVEGNIDPADPAIASPPATTQPALLEQLQPVFRQIGRAWAWLLKTIRSLLPLPQREKLSDTALSSILIGTMLLLVWINSALKPKPAPAPAIATRPAIEQPAADIPIPDSLPAPAEPAPATEPEPGEDLPIVAAPIEPPVAVAPEPIERPAIEPEPDEPFAAAEPIEPQPIEPELSAPGAPVAIEPEPDEMPVEPEPEAIEPPIAAVPEQKPSEKPPELTPEQALIAAIQEQVGDITNQYGDGLVKTIQANFRSSRLTVTVDDAWYRLNPSRQDKLAAEMLDRARSLNFRRVELSDAQGTLVARSPVVGSEMIILQRSPNSR